MTFDLPPWLQILVAWLGAVATTYGLSFTKLGEMLLNRHWERKLTDLKHEQNEKIEALRAELQHLGDRGKRSNEREFLATSAVWEKFVDAWLSTQRAVMQFIRHPDLNRLTVEEVTTFLLSTDLSEEQKRDVEKAENKNDVYARTVELNTINEAGRDIYDLRQLVRKNSIYMPEELTTEFKNVIELLSGAQVERSMALRHPAADRYEHGQKLLEQAEPIFAKLSAAVRARIFRP
jgi:hypothetical protein